MAHGTPCMAHGASHSVSKTSRGMWHSMYAAQSRHAVVKAGSSGVAWRVVHGAWCMAHGVWRMVHGAWHMVCGAWCVAHGAWRMVCGAWCVAHGAWYVAHGAWRMAHCAWRMVHGAWCMPQSVQHAVAKASSLGVACCMAHSARCMEHGARRTACCCQGRAGALKKVAWSAGRLA
eukprot:27543-Chlamydomonas_euryale.AAC.11